MRIHDVLDDNHMVFEYVDGKTYYDTLTKKFTGKGIEFCGNGVGPGVGLNMDDFIEKWCTGSVSAMEKIKAETGYYLGDRNLGNFIVKNYGTPDAILVLIDYDFQKDPLGLKSLVEILIDVMENNLDKNDGRWKPLREYLESVKNKSFSISSDMLNQFAKIKKQ